MLISVIVTTYNRPDALAAVLDGLSVQSDRDFEVLIADDGSRPETGTLVARYALNYPVRLIHVWQEDDGFRAGAARNRAAARAMGEYLLFIDGDCVPRPDFVASHRALAEQGCFVAGNRVLLSQAFTSRVLSARVPLYSWGRVRWLMTRLSGRINRCLPLLTLPDAGWRKRQPERWQGARTCNLAVWRSDFLHVNGFDERYAGWGHEDADLAVRLIRAGVIRKDGRYATAVLHLWHRESDRSHLPENEQRLAAILADQRVRAEIGLDRYLKEAKCAS
jgi:glycosyltransferase involved in cell wall biosynthesis